MFQNGESVMHAAALNGQVPIMKRLLAAGADPSLPNQEGDTPLQLARHPNVIEFLRSVEKGAKI